MSYNVNAVLEFIISRQNANGSFSTHERYPVVRPHEDWLILPDSSPFITANILCSLLSVNKPELKPVIDKGCSFLQSCMGAQRVLALLAYYGQTASHSVGYG